MGSPISNVSKDCVASIVTVTVKGPPKKEQDFPGTQ